MTYTEMTDLDVWIAINLFGYKWTDNPDDSTVDDVKQVWRIGKKDVCVISHTWQYKHSTIKRFNHQWNNFQPTRVGKDAFEVLRKCNEKLDEYRFRTQLLIFTFAGEPAVGYEEPMHPLFVMEYDKTLEMAICKFAKSMFEKKI